jgi:hypothetical protein
MIGSPGSFKTAEESPQPPPTASQALKPSPLLPHQPSTSAFISTPAQPVQAGSITQQAQSTQEIGFPALGTVFESFVQFKAAIYNAAGSVAPSFSSFSLPVDISRPQSRKGSS